MKTLIRTFVLMLGLATLLLPGAGFAQSLRGMGALPPQQTVEAPSYDVVRAFQLPDSISATFEGGYTISTSAGTGGTISPVSITGVAPGTTRMLTVTPRPGYYIQSISGCGGTPFSGGSAYTTARSYTTGPITANCTVSATFGGGYTISTSTGTGGTISPFIITGVASGTTRMLTVTPRPGYYIQSISGCSGTLFSGGSAYTTARSYTTGPITANCTITAAFASLGPVLSNPSVSNITSSGATFTVTSNMAANGYWLVRLASNPAPTVDQVVRGGNYSAMTANTPFTRTLSGLTPNTSYRLYFIASSVAGTSPLLTLPFTTSGTSYLITYNYQENGGGAVTKGSARAVSGSAVDLSPVASKTGWDFLGWNTNKDATSALVSYTMPGRDLTLFAIYRKTLTATFQDYNGASLSSRVTKATMFNKATSTPVTLLAQQTYNDGAAAWTPAGWSSQTAADVTPLASNTQNISANITFYGLYRRNAYTLSYNANGGTSTPPSQSARQQANSSAIAVRANLPLILAGAISKPNATFDGWASATGTKYNAGASIQITANTVMLATWKDVTPPVSQYPQYIAVRAPTGYGEPNGNPDYEALYFDPIINIIGTRGKPERRLAFMYTFSYMDLPVNTVKTALSTMLRLSREKDLPIIIQLDGLIWWESRRDLWNFWDSTKPGYNPANVDNVERFDWGTDASTAVRAGWRNWTPTRAGQFRVAPQPNLASDAVRKAQTDRLDVFLPRIKSWYDGLPADKKYLFGGLVLGWETSTYINAPYIDGGNDMLSQPAADDPARTWGAAGNVLSLGYAAAQKLGLQPEKGPIKTETIDAIIKDYHTYMMSHVIEKGIDPKKLITHTIGPGPTGGTKRGGIHTGSGAVVDIPGVLPGWSLYARAPYTNLGSTIDRYAAGRPWANIELDNTDEMPAGYLKELINYKNNRYVGMLAWVSIKDNSHIINEIKDALNE